MNNKKNVFFRKLSALIILSILYSSLSFGAYKLGFGSYFINMILFSIISVVIAHFIWPSSALIIGFVMFLLISVYPSYMVYEAVRHSESSVPYSELLLSIEWHWFLISALTALGTSLLMHRLNNPSG